MVCKKKNENILFYFLNNNNNQFRRKTKSFLFVYRFFFIICYQSLLYLSFLYSYFVRKINLQTKEKELEEFVGPDEEVVSRHNLKKIGVALRSLDKSQLEDYTKFINLQKTGHIAKMGKKELVREIQKLVPQLNHIEVNRNLDAKM